MTVLGERARLASAVGEGARFQCWWRGRNLPLLGRGRALPVLRERARLASAGGEGAPCQCWGIGRALPVLGDRARLASACRIGSALPVLA